MLSNSVEPTKFYLVVVLVSSGLLFSNVANSHELEVRDSELEADILESRVCKIEDELQALLDLHNQSRSDGLFCKRGKQRSAPPLEWSCKLADAARKHADDMHSNGFLSHEGSDDSTMGGRVKEAGYQWRNVGENIAQGYEGAESVYQSWLNSIGHCENIGNTNYQDFGAAKSGLTWVVIFGRQ